MSGRYVRAMIMKNTYVRAIVRFWPLTVVGLVLAIVAGVEMVASVHLSGLKLRTPPRYTATQLLLVNSPQNPFVRTAVTAVVPQPAKTTVVHSGGHTGSSSVTAVPQAPKIAVHSPDVGALVRAANLYPRFIESDEIAAVRDRMFGTLHGTVTASALGSFQTPTKYRASQFPVIQLTGTARHAKPAIELVEKTATAFEGWLKQSQDASHVPTAERILVTDLKRPDAAVKTGGPKMGLPIFMGIGVFVLFLALAIVLDRLRTAALAAAAAEGEPAREKAETAEPALTAGGDA